MEDFFSFLPIFGSTSESKKSTKKESNCCPSVSALYSFPYPEQNLDASENVADATLTMKSRARPRTESVKSSNRLNSKDVMKPTMAAPSKNVETDQVLSESAPPYTPATQISQPVARMWWAWRPSFPLRFPANFGIVSRESPTGSKISRFDLQAFIKAFDLKDYLLHNQWLMSLLYVSYCVYLAGFNFFSIILSMLLLVTGLFI